MADRDGEDNPIQNEGGGGHRTSLESAIHNQNKDENVDKFGERNMQFTSNEISIRTRIYLSIGSKIYIFFHITSTAILYQSSYCFQEVIANGQGPCTTRKRGYCKKKKYSS